MFLVKKLTCQETSMKQKLFNFLPVFILTVLALVVAFLNISRGTWFIGWDSLMSELNFKVGFTRSLLGVWQEFQGVGLQGGHGYITDIVHLGFTYLLSFFMPLNYVRYCFTFLFWYLGGVGCFYVTKRLLEKSLKNGCVWVSFVSFIGSTIYLFHPYTVQNFYVQLDSFVWFYGLLPWSIFLLTYALESLNKRNILYFFIFQLLFSFVGFIPPVFVGYFLISGVILLTHFFAKRNFLEFKKIVLLFTLIITANLYWLAPLSYFTLSQNNVYLNSKLNSLTTSENVLKSKYYADPLKIIYGEGFYFDALDIDTNTKEVVPILKPWITYLSTPIVKVWLIVIFIVACVGVFANFSFAPVAIVSFLLLWKVDFLHFVPILNQAFRIPFTKLSITYVFFTALMVAFGLFSIKKLFIRTMATLLILTAVLFISYPSFQGNFLYKKSKVDLPKEYLSVIDYFKGQPSDRRIATFPINSFNGWYITKWGYTGSGFLFYGLEQPILDQAFNVWSVANETYYQQISTATHSRDLNQVKNIFEKYNVSYALFDESVTLSGQNETALSASDFEKILTDVGGRLVWSEGYLKVYDLSLFKKDANFLSSPKNYYKVNGSTDYARTDSVFDITGNYIDTPDPSWQYPFANVTSERISNISYKNGFEGVGQTSIKRDVYGSGTKTLSIPSFTKDGSQKITATLTYEKRDLTILFHKPYQFFINDSPIDLGELPSFHTTLDRSYDKILVALGGQQVFIKQGEVSKVFDISILPSEPFYINIFNANSRQVDISKDFTPNNFHDCWTRDGGNPESELKKESDSIAIKVKDKSLCLSTKLPVFAAYKSIILVDLPYKSINGARPHFCIVEEGGSSCITNEIFYHSNPSIIWSSVSRSVELEAGKRYWLNISARPPDDKGKSWEISYKSPEIKVYSQVAGFKFLPEAWGSFWDARNISVSLASEKNTLTISFFGSVDDFVSLNNFSRFGSNNCDLDKRGFVEKIFLDNSISYIAQDKGASCDFSVLSNSTRDEGILRLSGLNQSGRGLKFYLFNQATSRNDLEYLLSNGQFDSSFSLIPWRNFPDSPYVLNLETRSFGDEVSKNTLNKIEFYPIPLTWLSRVNLADGQNASQSQVEIKNTQKFGTGFYKAVVLSSLDSGLLVLEQGYDKAWIGISNFRILNHFKYNSWANAWEISEGDQVVYLIFLPQLMESGAMILELVILLTLMRLLRRIHLSS